MSGTDATRAFFGTWSLPADTPGELAFAAAIIVFALGFARDRPLLRAGTTRQFLAIAAGVAALLSVFYVASYLRGGPRIIDASTYFLQGRALSHGDLAWTPLEPTASFRGRFLVYREGLVPGAPGTLGGIFPPGYPLLLAAGFLIGAPMIIGPLLAAALVVVTYRLARSLSANEDVARTAALLSVVCGALRYHTADTMSHGATALAVALALDFALRGRAWAAWLAVGYVVATRPVSALPIGLVVLASRWRNPRALLGLLPGVALLLRAQHDVTGAWLTSTQRIYYAMSDGPPGCFRFGFGADTGCIFEHGDFVSARFDGDFTVLDAVRVALRRLHHHLMDIANFEPLAFLALVPAVKSKTLPARLLTALIGLQVLAYAPFYFDGDYPGGGARFFADVLPVEHALIAFGVMLLARNARYAQAGLHFVLGAACAGFAVHASFEHGKLRDRDGGTPLFEPDVVAQNGLTNGLVFVDTDHGFNLAYDPSVRTAKNGVVYARLREDDRDRLLFDSLDRPETYKYVVANGAGRLVPWAPPLPTDPAIYRFEAEAEWPALLQEEGMALPGWTHACASGKRALVLTPSDGDVTAVAEFELPVPVAGTYEVTVNVANARIPFAKTRNEAPRARGEVAIGDVHVAWDDPMTCEQLPVQTVKLSPPHFRIRMTARGGPAALDSLTLRSLGSR